MYIPRRGDIVWINFDPQAGHEQADVRPALVLSDEQYNRRLRLAIMCPITTRRASYRRDLDISIPPEVTIRNRDSTGLIELTGVVLSDHIKSLDWLVRDAMYAGDMPNDVINQVLQIVGTLVKIWDVQ
ncbi:mRNA-degrading endonuclease [Candidatus Poribacteria bacterium]|nr:mRNA-degrading endonuclease [Candidatus Poribacteria bacterium]MYF54776.1 mRNA-degrading endonuclease [Candidatus Poribacteria bacterium]